MNFLLLGISVFKECVRFFGGLIEKHRDRVERILICKSKEQGTRCPSSDAQDTVFGHVIF